MNFGSAPSRVQQLREAMVARPPAPQQQARAGLLPTQQPAPTAGTAPAAPAASAPPSSPLANLERKVLAGRDPRWIGTPLDSPVARVIGGLVRDRVVTPWDTETKYNEHAAAFIEYQQIQQKHASHLRGGVFVVNTPQDQAKYQELQRAATRVETTGQAFEQTRDRELFGISRRVADLNKGAADFLNLPAVPAEAEPYIRTVVPASLHATQHFRGQVAPKPVHEFIPGAVLGGYERFRVEPLTAAGSVAVGFLGGAAMKGATLLPKVGPVVVSKGPAIGKGIEALYGGSVAVRTGMAGPDAFEMGREFGGILTTEAIPMYGGVKAFTVASPRVAAGISRAKSAYASYKIRDAPAAQVKAGGWAEPPEEVILEGLKMRESMRSFVPARSLSRGRPGKSGRLVEVGPGKYVDRGMAVEYHSKLSRDLDKHYLREFGVDRSAWRRPIPEEYLAREDIAEVPAHWRTPEFGGPPAPITVTKMYAGIPIRPALRPRKPPAHKSIYSRAGQPLRIRPPRADLTMADATKTRFLLPLASGTGETLASGETILSRLEPTIASRAQSATLTASGLRDIIATRQDIDTSELTKSSLTLDYSLIPASALRSAQAQDSLLLTTSRLTSRQRQRSDTIPRLRLRETTVILPRLRPKPAPRPKIPRTPMVFGLPEWTPPKKKRKKKV